MIIPTPDPDTFAYLASIASNVVYVSLLALLEWWSCSPVSSWCINAGASTWQRARPTTLTYIVNPSYFTLPYFIARTARLSVIAPSIICFDQFKTKKLTLLMPYMMWHWRCLDYDPKATPCLGTRDRRSCLWGFLFIVDSALISCCVKIIFLGRSF